MSLKSYSRKGHKFWKVDFYIDLPDGRKRRILRTGIPTRELAEALITKAKTEGFAGKHFDHVTGKNLTVAQAWLNFEPNSKLRKKSWKSDRSRAKHLMRHLGNRLCCRLTPKIIVNYYDVRRKEITERGRPPTTAAMNREISLLRRILNYAVENKQLDSNPIARIDFLEENNVRHLDIPEMDVMKMVEAADRPLDTFLLIARDTGMRKASILNLKRSQIFLDDDYGIIKLAKQDVKHKKAMTVVLTKRATGSLIKLLEAHNSDWVFVNPATGKQYVDIRKMYRRALKKAGLEDKGYWIHDQRRVFATSSRRAGVDETTIMSQTGHSTRSAFERYNIVATQDQIDAVKKMEAAANQHVRFHTKDTGHEDETDSKTSSLEAENKQLQEDLAQLKQTLGVLLRQSGLETKAETGPIG